MEQEYCDKNCNECPLIRHPNSRLLTKILNDAFDVFGDEFYEIVRSYCPNMTVCYECRIDDFVHGEDCDLVQ